MKIDFGKYLVEAIAIAVRMQRLNAVNNHRVGGGEETIFSRRRRSCSKWPKPFMGKKQLAKAAARAASRREAA